MSSISSLRNLFASRRGFGAVQIVSLVLVALLTVIFLFYIAYSKVTLGEVDAVHEGDIRNVYAQMVLDNLLAMPLLEPSEELLKYSSEPTVMELFMSGADSRSVGLELLPVIQELNNVALKTCSSLDRSASCNAIFYADGCPIERLSTANRFIPALNKYIILEICVGVESS